MSARPLCRPLHTGGQYHWLEPRAPCQAARHRPGMRRGVSACARCLSICPAHHLDNPGDCAHDEGLLRVYSARLDSQICTCQSGKYKLYRLALFLFSSYRVFVPIGCGGRVRGGGGANKAKFARVLQVIKLCVGDICYKTGRDSKKKHTELAYPPPPPQTQASSLYLGRAENIIQT